MLVGQPLDIAKGQPDVANVIVHRTGDTLVVVDTGATEGFRGAISAAAERLGGWDQAILLTTHGHLDHVGNNDIVDVIAAEHGVADVAHFVPAHDVAQLLDPHGYWSASLGQLTSVLDGFDDIDGIADFVVAGFAPQHPIGATTRTFESLPLEHLRIGPVHATGWTLCDGAVQVLRTQGHCAGQVIVRLTGPGLVHLSDESNGPCAPMHDADQVKMLTALGNVLTMVETGTVTHVTEGHEFTVHETRAARDRLTGLLDSAAAIDAGLQPSLADEHSSTEFVTAYEGVGDDLGMAGTNTNPMFSAMSALGKLRDLGMTRTGPSGGWIRPVLR